MNKKINDRIESLLSAVGEEITNEDIKEECLHTLKSGLTGLVWSAIRAARTEPEPNRSIAKFPVPFRPFVKDGLLLEAPPGRQMRYDQKNKLLKMWPTADYVREEKTPPLPFDEWPVAAHILHTCGKEDEQYELDAPGLHLSATPTEEQKKTCSRFYVFLAPGDGVLPFEPLRLTGEDPKPGQPYVKVDVLCRVLRRMDENRIWTLGFRYANGRPRYSITDGRWLIAGFASVGGIPAGNPEETET